MSRGVPDKIGGRYIDQSCPKKVKYTIHIHL